MADRARAGRPRRSCRQRSCARSSRRSRPAVRSPAPAAAPAAGARQAAGAGPLPRRHDPRRDSVAIGADHGGFALKAASWRSTSRAGLRRHRLRHERPRRRRLPGLRPRRRPPRRERRLRVRASSSTVPGSAPRWRPTRCPACARRMPTTLPWPATPRAQLRQRADARRTHDRRGPGPRDRRHVPRHPVGRGTARRTASRRSPRSSSSYRSPKAGGTPMTAPPDERAQLIEAITRQVLADARRPGTGAPTCVTCAGGVRGPLRAQGARGGRTAARRGSRTAARRATSRATSPGTSTTRCCKPDATAADIDKLCAEAVEHGFASVCINPVWVSRARRDTSRAPTSRSPRSSASRSAPRMSEIKALRGAPGDPRRRPRDRHGDQHRRAQVRPARPGPRGHRRGARTPATRSGAINKVIIETALLTDEEKVIACQLAKEAKADFVKTSHRLRRRAAPPCSTSRSCARRSGRGSASRPPAGSGPGTMSRR